MNSFGKLFRVSIYGESHGASVGIVIDGCPAGMPLQISDFRKELDRRKSGAKGTTPRKEPDVPRIMSGVFQEHSTGAPIMVQFDNTNARSRDYSRLKDIPRPDMQILPPNRNTGGSRTIAEGGIFRAA
jgi:chorismate synthase